MSAFRLAIRLGDDEMRTNEHVAAALERVARQLRQLPGGEGLIKDANGNRVGEFRTTGMAALAREDRRGLGR